MKASYIFANQGKVSGVKWFSIRGRKKGISIRYFLILQRFISKEKKVGAA